MVPGGVIGFPRVTGASETPGPEAEMLPIAFALEKAVREKTATAQSDVAQLILCDLIFMARTMSDSSTRFKARRVTALLPRVSALPRVL